MMYSSPQWTTLAELSLAYHYWITPAGQEVVEYKERHFEEWWMLVINKKRERRKVPEVERNRKGGGGKWNSDFFLSRVLTCVFGGVL